MSLLTRGPVHETAGEPVRKPRTGYSDEVRRARDEATRTVRRALLSYVGASVGALVLVGIGATAVADRVATDGAVADAGFYTAKFAQLSVGPLVTQDLVDHDPAALARLDAVVRTQMAEHEVLRVKVWSTDAEILYSDEPRLIGRHYEIEPDDREVLDSLGLDAHVSPSTKEENEFESDFGATLEVYAGVRAANGEPVLVEAYLPIDRLDALRNTLNGQIRPLVMLSLLALELLLLPLAVMLARRIARGQEERAILSLLAAHSAQSERDAIAAELHDGVIQDLVAVGFGLGTVRAVAERTAQHEIGAAAAQLNDIVREDVRVLRGLIGSLSAGDLDETPVSDVVVQAALEAEQAGLVVHRHVEPVEPPARDVRTALRLVAREAVRNAVKHSGATTLSVRLEQDGADVVLEVTDDGRGFDPAEAATTKDGHLGLTLYERAAEAAGGRSTLTTTVGGGTRLVLRVPENGLGRRAWWARRR